MAIYHCSTKPLARSSGRSAVAAAAYRSGDCLVDERQGIEHDYTRRRGVIHAELVLPEGAGAWTRAELWNAAEKAEKRKDARTAREWEVALPEELGDEERRDLAVRFARGLASKYGCAVDVALHAPDREGDQRNWHAHLLATTRKVTAGAFSEKCAIELSDAKRLSLGLAPARIEVEAVRQMWAQEVNRQLTAARRPERVDHRSLAAQREEAIQKGQSEKVAELDRAPQVKLGWSVIQMERRGVVSDRGNQLRQVQAENVQRKAAVIDIGQLRSQLAQRQQEEAARRRETEQKKDPGSGRGSLSRAIAGCTRSHSESLAILGRQRDSRRGEGTSNLGTRLRRPRRPGLAGNSQHHRLGNPAGGPDAPSRGRLVWGPSGAVSYSANRTHEAAWRSAAAGTKAQHHHAVSGRQPGAAAGVGAGLVEEGASLPTATRAGRRANSSVTAEFTDSEAKPGALPAGTGARRPNLPSGTAAQMGSRSWSGRPGPMTLSPDVLDRVKALREIPGVPSCPSSGIGRIGTNEKNICDLLCASVDEHTCDPCGLRS